MSKFPIFQVGELVAGTPPLPTAKFFLLETDFTSDGPRTRVCSGRWNTYIEANTERERREKEAHPS